MAIFFRSRLGRRGKSRPSSGQLSGGCGVLFFGVFLLAGIAGEIGVFWGLVRPLWRANHVYVETSCVVLGKRIAENHDGDGTTYRPEIHIKYTADGQEFQTWTYSASKVWSSGRARKQRILDQFVVGNEYPCWYDPDEPSLAVLVRGWSWAYLFALLPLVFVVIGAGGIYATLRGARKTGPASTSAVEGASLDATGSMGIPAAGEQLANVPVVDLSNRPSTRLKYQLSLGISSGCALLGYFNSTTQSAAFPTVGVESFTIVTRSF